MTLSMPAILILATLSSSPAGAQPRPLPDAVRIGLDVSVVDDQGRKIDGRVVSVSGETLRVAVRREMKDIPTGRILRIERRDSLRNGALIGLGLGLGFGIAGALMDPQYAAGHMGFVVISTIGNSIIWTALGTGVDAMFNNRRTLYERGGGIQSRIAPVVAPGVRAVALSFSW